MGFSVTIRKIHYHDHPGNPHGKGSKYWSYSCQANATIEKKDVTNDLHGRLNLGSKMPESYMVLGGPVNKTTKDCRENTNFFMPGNSVSIGEAEVYIAATDEQISDEIRKEYDFVVIGSKSEVG